MLHESNFNTVRIEDYETLHNDRREVFDSHDVLLLVCKHIATTLILWHPKSLEPFRMDVML